MKKLTILILALLLSVSAFSKEIVVSAAASLKNCLEEILPEYEKLSGDKVLLNLGGSGTLRTQIENGVPVDLFISADQKNVKILVDKNIVKKENTYDFLSNSLILVKSPYSKSSVNSVEGLKNSDVYLVIGNPDTAPVGNYTLTALKNLEILDKLNREKLIYAKDVSAVVQYVEMGEADFGVIYNSDKNRMKNPIVVEEFPENSYDRVIYSVAILNNSDDVKKLFEFLRENKEVVKKYGFVVM
ncbi:molybdate ABC transporter substrate-binding protein [uncultured Fusobacterium sp.]|uniref:molybdate ABC transporter substrate-binding protein n=1 Tax=uncultured Fusobacterium sp. TaxID=159267 RepID=UPI0025D16446|nr:molybdate ABC transporter substrate-binding protein [uncultured Fusobacterium sp.]